MSVVLGMSVDFEHRPIMVQLGLEKWRGHEKPEMIMSCIYMLVQEGAERSTALRLARNK